MKNLISRFMVSELYKMGEKNFITKSFSPEDLDFRKG